MNFTTWQFLLLFLPLTLVAFRLTVGPRAAVLRQALLIAASLLFYGVSGLANLAVLTLSMAGNFAAGRLLGGDALQKPARRRTVMWAAVAFNLSLLLGFKLMALGDPAEDGFLTSERILIPLALSFVTFQQIGFVVACHKRQILRPGLFDYLFFVAFFPQLVMGPIVRFDKVAAQLKSGALVSVTRTDFAAGLAIFLFGLAKKVLLADPLAGPVERIFEAQALSGATALESWFAIVAFQLQLFLDFSAYAEMAIGLGRMFGIALPINFDRPLKAINRFDLWRRWHITFVMFMRVHVFLPLVRHAKVPVAGALAVTGILSGLWHGLGWTFVIWGLLQTGILLFVHYRGKWRRTEANPAGARRVAAILLTFLTSALIGALFRAPNLETAGQVYAALLPWNGLPGPSTALAARDWLIAAIAAAFIWGWPDARDFFRRYWTAIDPRPDHPRRRPAPWVEFEFTRTWAIAGGLVIVAILLMLGQSGRFIYVQF